MEKDASDGGIGTGNTLSALIDTWHSDGLPMNEPIQWEDWSPLHLACAQGDLQCVTKLLNWGSQPNYSSETLVLPRHTPLHIASRYGHQEVVSELLRAGAEVSRVDNHGFSPLHYGALGGHQGVVQALLEADDTSAQLRSTQGGLLAADLAEAGGHGELAASLRAAAHAQTDPSRQRLRAWLSALGVEDLAPKFDRAGYDLEFITQQGLGEDDLDCVGVPEDKLGVRKKLMSLHRLTEFLPSVAPPIEELSDRKESSSEEPSSAEETSTDESDSESSSDESDSERSTDEESS